MGVSMIKLLCGPLNRQAWEGFGCLPVYNWNHPELVCEEARAAGKVWPMISGPVTAATVIDQYRWPFDHILWYNEPPLPSLPYCALSGIENLATKRHIVGNFKIQFALTGNWSHQRGVILPWYEKALALTPKVVLGVHLYRQDLPSTQVQNAKDWFSSQLDAILADVPVVAMTEYGVLLAGTSWANGQGPDVEYLTDYMQYTWTTMRNRSIYAASWYMAQTDNKELMPADGVLCNPDGTLRPLGEVYRDLPTGDEEGVEPQPSGTGWVRISQSLLSAGAEKLRLTVERWA